MEILSVDHQNRYERYIAKDKTSEKDIERLTLFFIISGNERLSSHVEEIYDFNDHFIKLNIFDSVGFSSSEKGLLELALNLYNNYSNNDSMYSVFELFSHLDDKNFKLALDAIRLRFSD